MPQPKLLQLMIRLALRQTESTPGTCQPGPCTAACRIDLFPCLTDGLADPPIGQVSRIFGVCSS